MKHKILNERYILYRKYLILALCLSVLNLTGVWLFSLWNDIPSAIRIRSGAKQEIDFHIPATGEIRKNTLVQSKETFSKQVLTEGKTKTAESLSVNMSRAVTFYGNNQEQYTLQVKLFGIIPFKDMEVSVINGIKVKPVGKPIGIYVKTDGILVLDTGDFKGRDKERKAPAQDLLKPGDYILQLNGKEIDTKKHLINRIEQSDGEPLVLTIQRNEQIFDLRLCPQQNEMGEYKLGIWIRDNAQGVGTMTYIDDRNGFGALGHGINDIDTTTLMKLKGGSLYRTEIISVKKGERGIPGEMTGLIAYSERNRIGDILDNSQEGIFGVVTGQFEEEVGTEYMDVALKQEVCLGPAQVLCCVGEETEYYDVEIVALHMKEDNINRGIELKITDDELLSRTGGIIQGMSGSPIIQNDKFVGAVTHVLVNDSTKGYGIFLEEMLE